MIDARNARIATLEAEVRRLTGEVETHKSQAKSADDALAIACEGLRKANRIVAEHEGGVPARGSRLWRCEQELVKARAQLADALAWSDDDKPIPEDEAIKAAHPTETKKFKIHDEAVRMVSAKRSKYALVDLVNWLLSRIEDLESGLTEEIEWRVKVEDEVDAKEKQLATLSRCARALSSRMHICAMRINDDDLCGGLATCEYRGSTGVHLYFCDKHRSRSTGDLPWAEEIRALLTALDSGGGEGEKVSSTRRPVVEWFADAMESKLRDNDHKGGWEDMAPWELLERLRQETAELDAFGMRLRAAWIRMLERPNDPSHRASDAVAILKEAADIANFAMMIADNCARGVSLTWASSAAKPSPPRTEGR